MIRFKKIEGNIKEKIPELVRTFKKDRRIVALYIFGSYAKGPVKPLSDIDIAALLDDGLGRDEMWDSYVDLSSKAANIFGTGEIDFVILNEAPYDLRFGVIKNGRCLFSRNERMRRLFQERAVLYYLDTKPLRDEIFFHLRERIRNGRFGYDDGRYKKDLKDVERIFSRVR